MGISNSIAYGLNIQWGFPKIWCFSQWGWEFSIVFQWRWIYMVFLSPGTNFWPIFPVGRGSTGSVRRGCVVHEKLIKTQNLKVWFRSYTIRQLSKNWKTNIRDIPRIYSIYQHNSWKLASKSRKIDFFAIFNANFISSFVEKSIIFVEYV